MGRRQGHHQAAGSIPRRVRIDRVGGDPQTRRPGLRLARTVRRGHPHRRGTVRGSPDGAPPPADRDLPGARAGLPLGRGPRRGGDPRTCGVRPVDGPARCETRLPRPGSARRPDSRTRRLDPRTGRGAPGRPGGRGVGRHRPDLRHRSRDAALLRPGGRRPRLCGDRRREAPVRGHDLGVARRRRSHRPRRHRRASHLRRPARRTRFATRWKRAAR